MPLPSPDKVPGPEIEPGDEIVKEYEERTLIVMHWTREAIEQEIARLEAKGWQLVGRGQVIWKPGTQIAAEGRFAFRRPVLGADLDVKEES